MTEPDVRLFRYLDGTEAAFPPDALTPAESMTRALRAIERITEDLKATAENLRAVREELEKRS